MMPFRPFQISQDTRRAPTHVGTLRKYTAAAVQSALSVSATIKIKFSIPNHHQPLFSECKYITFPLYSQINLE